MTPQFSSFPGQMLFVLLALPLPRQQDANMSGSNSDKLEVNQGSGVVFTHSKRNTSLYESIHS